MKIREDVDAHDSWKGEKIEIIDFNPTGIWSRGDFTFEVVDDDKERGIERFTFLYFDEIVPILDKCDHDKALFHEGREEFFCPWCEND